LFTSSQLRIIAYKVEGALLEDAELRENGPVIRIVHRFWTSGTICVAGEEIWAASIVHNATEVPIRLSLALRFLLNYLAGTRHVPQSATQIAAGIKGGLFYTQHGANSGVPSKRQISRPCIKEYVKRLRASLHSAFREPGLNLDSYQVLTSRETDNNEVLYQLRARPEWVHLGYPEE
jgi:hypothetical protein